MLVRTHNVKNIVDFVDKMGVCDSVQVATVFFPHHKESKRYARSKLMMMYKNKLIKRKKTFLGTRYIYYLDTFPQQFEHKYLLAELYTRICKKYGVKNCTCETEYRGIESMRPDGFITVKVGKYKYMFFVEIHISNNDFNYNKYLEVYHKRLHIGLTQDANIFPVVLAITDSKITNDKELEFIKIDTDFNNFNGVICDIIKGA